jgi:hypothetical protein
MADKKEKKATRINIPGRFSYAHLFTPTRVAGDDDSKPKYSTSILWPKKDKATTAKVQAAIEAAVVEGTGKTFKGKRPAKLKLPIRDGDEVFDEKGTPEYKGMWYINANSTQKPQVVGPDREPIDEDEFYSGCFGRISVNFYAFDQRGNRGIAAGLGNAQKLKDGERLSGGASADEDFDDDDDYEFEGAKDSDSDDDDFLS